jgi:pimeloyl-ACP methyl ester carboxylesterase
MTGIRWLLIIVLGYVGVMALMYLVQRAMMYFPEKVRTAPAEAGFAEAQEIVLDSAGSERVIAWHVAPRGGKPVVLYFHGNGGALRYRVARFRALVADGAGLVALSYRGYAGSSGRPTEAGLIADGTAAYEFAASRYPADRIVLWGESLGSGVAVAVAAEKTVSRVVLEAPFASAVDIAARAYPFVPVLWLMKDQFRSDLRVGKVTAPVLIMAWRAGRGRADRFRQAVLRHDQGAQALRALSRRRTRGPRRLRGSRSRERISCLLEARPPGPACSAGRHGLRLHRQQALALHAFAGELARPADRFRLFAGLLFGGFFVMAAELHLAENALALHFLLERLEGLIDVVVTNENLHASSSQIVFGLPGGVLDGGAPQPVWL